MTQTFQRTLILDTILAELDYAYAKHGKEPWGRHEFAAILREEFDELWDAVKRDLPTDQLLVEAMQIACVCIRYAETGDKHRGPHPDGAILTRLTDLRARLAGLPVCLTQEQAS